MSHDDNALGTALSLAVGGAAGYVAGRWIVAPHLANGARSRAASPMPSSSSATAVARLNAQRATMRSTGALVAGPSGDMRPIDPYVDAAPSVSVVPSIAPGMPITATTQTSSLPTTTEGPITTPSQLAVAASPSVTAPASVRGPITRPSQLDERPTAPRTVLGASAPRVELPVTPASSASPRASFATSPRVRRFDKVFERYRGSLPIAYVRALVERESDGRPSVRAGSAIGLMQIVPVVLADYNKRHGTAYQSEHLTDPAINVAIGCELLRLIAASYRKYHPRIPNLETDWNNPRFVELLTFGWNAGYSEAGGVGRVAQYLEAKGAVDITIDQVSAHARLAGASKHLFNPAKVAWSKGVVALYQRERVLARSFATS
jgi:soluble lytic murein transglycosylase-like protein